MNPIITDDEKIKEKVISESALEEALRKCVKGVSYKASVAYFFLHAYETIPELHEQLENGTYKARKPKHHKVYYPKERNLVSIAFKDRVFQRSFNDNVVYPEMTRDFVFDNMACQKGKGTDKARERAKRFLHEYYRKYGADGYILKTDIKKYYDNIPHTVAEKTFAKHLSGWSLEQVMQIIENQYPSEKGFNPGSQMIQILGIATPNKIDHFMKEKMHLEWYMRYQDDSLHIHQSKEYLLEVKAKQEELLAEIGLELNQKKTKIVKLTDGFDFLGFHFRLTKTGKVIMTVLPEKVKQEKRHLRNIVRKVKKGDLPREQADAHFEGIITYMKKGNSNKLITNMQSFYKELLQEKETENEHYPAGKRNQGKETEGIERR